MNTSVLSSLMARGLSRRVLARWVTAVVLAAAFGSATAGGKPYSYFVTGNAQAPSGNAESAGYVVNRADGRRS